MPAVKRIRASLTNSVFHASIRKKIRQIASFRIPKPALKTNKIINPAHKKAPLGLIPKGVHKQPVPMLNCLVIHRTDYAPMY